MEENKDSFKKNVIKFYLERAYKNSFMTDYKFIKEVRQRNTINHII